MKQIFNLHIALLSVWGLSLFFIACEKTDSHRTESNHLQMENLRKEHWLFNTQYIRNINDSSWEKFSLSAMNNYTDFKIDFTFISTGKTQNCGLYAKGILVDRNTQTDGWIKGSKANKQKKNFLLRPNLIPQTTIVITKESGFNIDSHNNDAISLEISDMNEFIRICGDAHQYAIGGYIAQ